MRRLCLPNGYEEIKTPLLYNKLLWEKSGHWGKYRENMFLILDPEADPTLPEEERASFSLKPMNCPSHHLFYQMKRRSYRELPLRLHTQDVLHRNEATGVLSGLTRVRQFQQDDAHIYLMESQIADEVAAAHEADRRRSTTRSGSTFTAKFATRPEKQIGDDALWDKAEARAQGRAREDRPARTSSSPATARSTARRSTSTSRTASAASGSSARSSSTTTRPSASSSATSARTTTSTARS